MCKDKIYNFKQSHCNIIARGRSMKESRKGGGTVASTVYSLIVCLGWAGID